MYFHRFLHSIYIIPNSTWQLYVMFIISAKIFSVYNRMHAPQTFYCHEQKASEDQILFPMSEGPIALVKFSLSYKPNFLKFIYPRLQICDCLFHFILCNNRVVFGYSLRKSVYSMLWSLLFPTLSLNKIISTPAGEFLRCTSVLNPM